MERRFVCKLLVGCRMSTDQRNYIDEIAAEIHKRTCSCPAFTQSRSIERTDAALYRIYALLCLAKGTKVTNRDIHDAWSAWAAGKMPNHKSLVPFQALDPEVQELDTEFTMTIREVATAMYATNRAERRRES